MPTYPNGTYEPVNVYDAPGKIVGMALDGELTARGLRNLAIDPARLTPKERDNVITRLKASTGNGSLSNALIDTVTNPWVWAMVLLSPTGLNHLQETGSYAGIGSRAAGMVEEGHGLFRSAGALNPTQVLHEGFMGPVQQVEQSIRNHVLDATDIIHERQRSFLQNSGLTAGLNPDSYNDPILKARAIRAKSLMHTSLNGLDRAREEGVALIDKGTPRAERISKGADVLNGAHERALASAEQEMPGLTAFIKAQRELYDARKRALFLDEAATAAAGKDVYSEKKIANLYRGLRNKLVSSRPGSHEAMAFIRHTIGEDAADLIAGGRVTIDEFAEMVRRDFSKLIPEYYAPRNVSEEIGRWGVTRKRKMLEESAARAMGADGSSISRTENTPLYNYAHYRDMVETYGAENLSDTFLRDMKKSREVTLDALGVPAKDPMRDAPDAVDRALSNFRDLDARGKSIPNTWPVRFLTNDPLDSLRRYINDTSRTLAMHIDEVGERAQFAIDRNLAEVARQGGKIGPGDQIHQGRFDEIYGPDGKVKGGFERFGLGYRNAADALEEQFVATRDAYERATLSELVIPTLMGSRTLQHNLTSGLAMKTQEMVRSFVKSDLFGAVREHGGVHGNKFADYLKAMSEVPFDEFGKGFIHKTTSTLYAGGMGFNLLSPLINLIQPLTLAASEAGLKNVLYGYGKAFGEMASYMADRAQMGWNITEDARNALIRKNFKFAHFQGEDIVQMGGRLADQLTEQAFNAGHVLNEPTTYEKFIALTLKGFEKAEWINRSTAAHAMEGLYKQAGRPIEGNLQFLHDARKFVNDTQFVSNPLTTPIMFQTDNPALTSRLTVALTHPLMRQYLSYPLRFFTRVVHDAPAEYGLLGGIKTFARGMGISALAYEMTKPWLGDSLNRGLFFSGATDIIPGFSQGQFNDSKSGPLPLPPVIDIPWGLVKGMIDDDKQVMVRSVAMLVPGGVAGVRALPALSGVFSPLQALSKTTVGWDRPLPDGRVPVFETATGNLVDYRTPSEIIFKGIGLDPGAYNQGPQVDNFLVKQRDEILQYRARFINNIMSNDLGGAEATQREYTTRFGVPLTVTQQQLAVAAKNRQETKPQRILDRVPNELKAGYTDYVRGVQAPRSAPEATPPTQAQASQSSEPPAPFSGGFSGFESF